MKTSLRVLALASAAGALLPSSALGQLCPIPCNGAQVVCHHQNGVRNHRGSTTIPIGGPNAATGNVPGDAFWKIWGCENGMSRGSAIHTFTSWEIGLASLAPGPATFDIPDLQLRSVTLSGSTSGVKEPDLSSPATFAATVGSIAVPASGGFRINVSLAAPAVAPPAFCPPTARMRAYDRAPGMPR